MIKIQKIWLGIFVAMFAVPEILFGFLTSAIASLFGKSTPALYQLFISQQFFIDHIVYSFVILGVEWLGILGLLIWNSKYKNNKALAVLLFILLFALSIIFYFGYSISHMNFF